MRTARATCGGVKKPSLAGSRIWLCALLIVCTVACAGRQSHVDVSPAEVALPAAPSSSGAEANPAVVEAPEDTTPIVLTRSLVRDTLRQGIGAFLANVELTPMMSGGRFAGFRLERARGLRRWNAAGLDLRVGDVITRVNGRSIERPEQAQAAFVAMAEANELSVDVVRAGAPVHVRLPVLVETSPMTLSDASAPPVAR
jgi:type II secretory pathway component PulC